MKKIIIISLAALAIAGCSQKKNAAQATQAQAMQPKAQTVKVMPAAKQDVKQDGVYSATVQAFAVNNIAPQSGSRIQKINVEVGDYVGKGQILAEMDRVQLDQAKLRLSNAEPICLIAPPIASSRAVQPPTEYCLSFIGSILLIGTRS